MRTARYFVPLSVLAGLLANATTSALAAQDVNGGCNLIGFNTVCTVNSPIVTRVMTAYDGNFHPEIFEAVSNNATNLRYGVQLPNVPLKYGDLVSIDADGCVQRGGHGQTWKRYVNPQGANTNRYYHGTLGVVNALRPNRESATGWSAMPNPVRIQDVIDNHWQPFWIPADQPLRLGYEDDGYLDNGYWGHDDGNPVQCSLDGAHGFGANATVTVTITHNFFVSFEAPHLNWDVVAAAASGSEQFDRNAWKLNPRWFWQTKPLPPNVTPLRFNEDCPTASGVIGAITHGVDQCTTQHPTTDNGGTAEEIGDFFSSLVGQSCGSGHLNWEVVSYQGRIFWDSHDSVDDDYNFLLVTPLTNGWASGITGDNTKVMTGVNPPTSEFAIKLEFNASETINHFDTKFWTDFRNAADQNKAQMVRNKEAIVIGLLGLDRAHDARSEIHPVFALAIHVNSDPSNDTWAIFVRNYGNEGLCGAHMHHIDPQTLQLRLPRLNFLPATAQATQIPFTFSNLLAGRVTSWGSNIPNRDAANQLRPDVTPASANQDTIVAFHLPQPAVDEVCPGIEYNPGQGVITVSDHPLVDTCIDGTYWDGELHLRWSFFTPGVGTFTSAGAEPAGVEIVSPLTIDSLETAVEDDAEPEALVRKTFLTLSPEQQTDYLAILPPAPEVLPDPFLVESKVVRHPPAPASVPPNHTVIVDPRLQTRGEAITMSFCGATHGELESEMGSCVPGDLSGDLIVDCLDFGIVEASLGKKRGQAGFDIRADINGDGVVNRKDLEFIKQRLPEDEVCQPPEERHNTAAQKRISR